MNSTACRCSASSPTGERNIVGAPVDMITSCSWRSRTSNTPRPRSNHRQTNGICERFHKTILQEFYQVTFRNKIYETIEQLQIDLDEWIDYYNN